MTGALFWPLWSERCLRTSYHATDDPRRPGQISVAKWSQSKSPNTRYRARQTIRLPDGTSRRIEVYGRRQRDAIEKCQAKAREVAQRAASANTVTVDQLFARLATEKKSLGRKAKTLHNLLGDYRRHIQPHIGSTPIAEITFEQLQAIQHRLTRQGKYRTAHLVTDILKSSYKFALRAYRKDIHEGRVRLLDLAQDLPTVQTPERKRVAQGLWSLAELNAFLDAAEEDYRVCKNLYYPLYLTACTAGLRRGELLGLPKAAVGRASLEETSSTVAYLDITTQLVYYGGKHHQETPKSDAGERRMYIPESLSSTSTCLGWRSLPGVGTGWSTVCSFLPCRADPSPPRACTDTATRCASASA